MITRFETKVFTWVDVQSPTIEEVQELHSEFKFDASIREELTQHIERSKVHFFNTHTYLVLQFPTSEGVVRGGKKKEVDFIIGTTFLITVHYEKIGSVNDVATDITDTKQIKTTRDLFFDIVYRQYKKIGKQLEDIDTAIQHTEQKIFGEHHRATVEKISEINHKILDFKRALRFHKDIWSQLEENVLFRTDAERLNNEYQKLWNALEHYQEITHSLQGTNDSLMAYRTNEVMKVLTLLNFIALPMAIIPQVIQPQIVLDPLIMFGIIFSVALMIYLGFKKNKWL